MPLGRKLGLHIDYGEEYFSLCGGGLVPDMHQTAFRIDDYGRDLTILAQQGLIHDVLGRDQEIGQIAKILTNSHGSNSVLVTGSAGCGKTALIEGLAYRVATGRIPELSGTILFELDTNVLTAGTMYRGQLEERYASLLNYATSNTNIVIVIDEIHTIFGRNPGETGNLSQALKPPLARGQITVIGITTTQEWLAGPGKDKAFERRFTNINLKPLAKEPTAQILAGFSKKNGYTVEQDILYAIVDSAEHLPNVVLPDAAISLFNEIMRHKSSEGAAAQSMIDIINLLTQEIRFLEKAELERAQNLVQQYTRFRGTGGSLTISHQDIQAALARLTGVPTSQEIAQLIANLEPRLEQKIVGQTQAVVSICAALTRSAAGLKEGARPMGSFCFTGPTGVGKTEVARALAEEVFNGKLIRFDMSEFHDRHTISRLIGSPPGYSGHESGGELTNSVAENPFSLIVFDEAEKAHPDILKILLQICEEGELTDSTGRRFSFSNTIIILTSNVGAELLLHNQLPAQEGEYHKLKTLIIQHLISILSPELINRLDEVILFLPLDYPALTQIFNLVLGKYTAMLQERYNIALELSPSAQEFLLREGHDPQFGARPLRRVLENRLITPLSQGILDGSYPNGSILIVDLIEEGGLRVAIR